MLWYDYRNTFSMMQCSYIEVIVSLMESAKMLGQGPENKAQTALQPILKRNAKHNLKGVCYA
jgi:hypothetical protein